MENVRPEAGSALSLMTLLSLLSCIPYYHKSGPLVVHFSCSWWHGSVHSSSGVRPPVKMQSPLEFNLLCSSGNCGRLAP